MKNVLRLSCLFFAITFFAASCNSSTKVESDADTTNAVIDTMPVDTTASGDTAIVDTIQ